MNEWIEKANYHNILVRKKIRFEWFHFDGFFKAQNDRFFIVTSITIHKIKLTMIYEVSGYVLQYF
jgi:hypothetical protein